MLAAFAVLSNASRGELPPIAKLRDAGESGVEQH
jgi:hypothetical protein